MSIFGIGVFGSYGIEFFLQGLYRPHFFVRNGFIFEKTVFVHSVNDFWPFWRKIPQCDRASYWSFWEILWNLSFLKARSSLVVADAARKYSISVWEQNLTSFRRTESPKTLLVLGIFAKEFDILKNTTLLLILIAEVFVAHLWGSTK